MEVMTPRCLLFHGCRDQVEQGALLGRSSSVICPGGIALRLDLVYTNFLLEVVKFKVLLLGWFSDTGPRRMAWLLIYIKWPRTAVLIPTLLFTVEPHFSYHSILPFSLMSKVLWWVGGNFLYTWIYHLVTKPSSWLVRVDAMYHVQPVPSVGSDLLAHITVLEKRVNENTEELLNLS